MRQVSWTWGALCGWAGIKALTNLMLRFSLLSPRFICLSAENREGPTRRSARGPDPSSVPSSVGS
ncbi:hypothetical protein Cadr_000025520 [Camelus dromedarius]|uniref:Uncharacterized protein n=1 Tax=Camelus dromedarius TaxID=9838 RepID=A0A5N4CLH8_CAMDR|nr:hypothetical protein Cadr_000025520 [Camelus dromedarius]